MSNDKNAIQQTLNATTGVAMTLGQLADRIVQVDETLRQQAGHRMKEEAR